jgi:WD40 repeat protein
LGDIAIMDLPGNVWLEVMAYLSSAEICLVGCCNKKLHRLSGHEVLWRRVKEPGTALEKKRIFGQRKRIMKNIATSSYQTYILEGHTDSVLHMDLKDNKLLTSSRDTTVRLWDLQRMSSKSYSGHTNWVTKAYHIPGGFVSVSADRSVIVWEDESKHVMRGHAGGVSQLKLMSDSIAVTGSHDRTVRLWNLRTRTNVNVFTEHTADISLLDADDRFIVSGANGESQVLLRDAEAGTVLRTLVLQGLAQGRMATGGSSVKIEGGMIYLGLNQSVRVWDARMHYRAADVPLPETAAEPARPQSARGEGDLPTRVLDVNVDSARGVVQMNVKEDPPMLMCGVSGLLGLVIFDMRTRTLLYYEANHDYPVVGIDCGRTVLKNVAVRLT